ncbi:MAG: electron transport complex subunit RsxA [Oscillospiraceae bacterium]|jgi:electron transport complex protein RnfA
MTLTGLISIALGAILIENFILVKFIGICPFLGVSQKMDTATGMGLAVTFVMGLASAACWLVNEYLLLPLGLGYMQTVAYILVIAALVQFVEMFLQKSIPALYSALGIYLPLITTNCAVLGVALLNTQLNYNFIESVVYGVTAGLGFLLAIVLFASIRERLEFSECPKSFEGFPIALVTASLLSMAFMGFSGLKIW